MGFRDNAALILSSSKYVPQLIHTLSHGILSYNSIICCVRDQIFGPQVFWIDSLDDLTNVYLNNEVQWICMLFKY